MRWLIAVGFLLLGRAALAEPPAREPESASASSPLPPNVSSPDTFEIASVPIRGCPGIGFSRSSNGASYLRATCSGDEAFTPAQLDAVSRALKRSAGAPSAASERSQTARISYSDSAGKHLLTLKGVWGTASPSVVGPGVVFQVYFTSFTKS